MRNSREKYGETTGAKAGMYAVVGFLSEEKIGKQKEVWFSQTAPVTCLLVGAEEDIGSAETRWPLSSPPTIATKKVRRNLRPTASVKMRERNCLSCVALAEQEGCWL